MDMRYITIFFIFFCSMANAEDFTERTNILREHILNADYPEVFDDKTYRVSIENVIFDDVDGNGDIEAIVHFKPHFRQSPTVVFYEFTKDGKVKRFMEALAPGALVKAGDYYLDSHSLGQGVDFTVEKSNDPGVSRKVIEAATQKASFGNLVLYPDFIHIDGRRSNGVPTYIDLSYLKPNNPISNCETFEFHEINQISTGQMDGKKYLAAWVGEEIYVYKISTFADDGFLSKDLWIIDLPKDFRHLNQGPALSYKDNSGEIIEFLKMPNKALPATAKSGA